MEDNIIVVVNYGGQFVNRPFQHYRGGFKTTIPLHADKLCVREVANEYPRIFKYHRDCKAYYKLNGDSFVSGLIEVADDEDISRMIGNARERPDKTIEIYVDHHLPKDHPDYHINQEKVKNMKVIDPFVRELIEDVNNDDEDAGTSGGDEESGPEKEASKEIDESYEKEMQYRMKVIEDKLRGPGGSRSKLNKGNKHQKKNTSEIICSTPRYAGKDNFPRETPETDATRTPRFQLVRRSPRNAVASANVDSNEVQNKQHGENVDSNNIEGSSGGGGKAIEATNEFAGFIRGKKLGKKLDIVIPEDRKRIVGTNAVDLISEAGRVVRQHAPLLLGTWKQIPEEKKNKMWEILQNKFFLEDDTLTKAVVYKQLGNQYRSYRNRLHKFYFLPYETMEIAAQNCPPDVDPDDWRELCKIFDGDKFKERSRINKENRAKQTSLHGNGSMGFARLEFELTNAETKERPKMSELWKKTHWSKKKEDWISEDARKVYNETDAEIKALKAEGKEVDEDQVYADILGEKKAYVRSRGPGPKPASHHEVKHLQEVKEKEKEKELAAVRELATNELAAARLDAEEARKEAEEAKKEASEANLKMTEMMKKQGDMSNQLDKMMMLLSNLATGTKTSSNTKKRKGR